MKTRSQSQKTNVKAQKIDNSILEIFRIIIANFQIEDKVGRPRYFQEIFLIAITKIEMVLEMFFFKFSNVDMSFGNDTFSLRSYIINKALSITKQVWIIDKKDFAIVILDTNNKTFIMYMDIKKQEEMLMLLKKQV